MIGRVAAAAFAGLFAALNLTASPAAAGGRSIGYLPDRYVDGRVLAVSRHGNGSVTGAVREGRYGPEVQLPGGTWVACRRSCSETLRVEALDMWENDGSLVGVGGFALECGVFGCLDIGSPR